MKIATLNFKNPRKVRKRARVEVDEGTTGKRDLSILSS